MTVGELIDFTLSLRQPGALIGFDTLYGDRIEALKVAIKEHYGSEEAWLALPESAPLSDEIERMAQDLVKQYEAWKRGEDA